MLEDEDRKKTRKGTTSCIEYGGKFDAFGEVMHKPVTESKVASLSKAVRDIESKLGYQSTETSEQTLHHPGSTPGADESDDSSSISDLISTDPPSHLRSLFQNDWVSVESKQLHDRQSKASAQLLDMARDTLQKLIPSKDEVSGIAKSASRWLVLLHNLLPQPFAVTSQQEMLEKYDEMHKPDVDAISLASWLLTIAITAQQIPERNGSPAFQLRSYQWYVSFHRTVFDTVERTIISHDRLISTIKGIGLAMHFFRLQMSQGNFQKAWLRLRHFIAIAEIMGLPKAFQAAQLNASNGPTGNEMQLQKAQLWQSLCAADGLAGMVINLPACTSLYQQTKTQALVIDSVVQPRVYLSRLTDVTTKIQYRDDMTTTQGSSAELYASVLELDRQLKVLASETPKSWWVVNVQHVESDHVVQFWHYCISMRVHLSFAMRQDPGELYTYSRLACMEACESVLERYQFIRRDLPTGIFISQALDLQAFTATVVLLLTSHILSYKDRSNFGIVKTKVDSVVAQTIKLMDEKAKDLAGFKIAQHGVTTIRSLIRLLQKDDEVSNVQELTLKIPLLGKVHIRRNSYTSQTPKKNKQPSFSIPSNLALRRLNERLTSEEYGHPPPNVDGHLESVARSQGEWQWDPLSWSIEDNYEDFFQDSLMSEDIDQFPMWPNNYSGFQLNN
ncbi:hypothetical protein G7Y89_g1818 [Cudoniella acicularis]|uniref:Transcription factor domain-containing protein n=1 Tax=Cudoniella acicularis TaxID=354080 RepID=A0A8H4W6M8_9HELO|nr:hypothetical protein G7Y89_g1818 [Cudoniella acicularis]